MRRLTIPEFHAELRAQGVSSLKHVALKCPMCGSVKSLADFDRAGVETEEAGKMIGFSCIGRVTNAGPYRKRAPKFGCDWTLGGFFRIHKLEVVDESGKGHARFEPATPDEAQAHEARSIGLMERA